MLILSKVFGGLVVTSVAISQGANYIRFSDEFMKNGIIFTLFTITYLLPWPYLMRELRREGVI